MKKYLPVFFIVLMISLLTVKFSQAHQPDQPISGTATTSLSK
ncbi:MAG: hypothetical protein V7746_08135 [Halioglobus sp.]